MGARGTRSFPPAGIRGQQGNTGPQGSGVYTISSATVLAEAIPGTLDVEYVASLSAGTLKVFGNVNIVVTNNCFVTITPLIGGALQNDFICKADVLASKSMNMCVIMDAPCAEGDSLELRIECSAGTATVNTSTLLYSIE